MTPKAIRRGLTAAVALLIGLGLAASASAQNFFYNEVVKDGRIYVFAIAKEFEAWSKSGEMGKALSRPGYGPKGETMVFDSEDAIGLYNMKNNRPGDPSAVAVPEKKPTMKVSWKDGKTTLDFDNAQVNISNRVQLRYTHVVPDDSVTLPGTEAAGDSQGSFRVRRAKFKVDGWFYKKELTYEIQMNWPAAVGSNVGAFLEDANIDWDISKKQTFRVKFGQFKYPQSRQELTSSGSQEFVDRSLVENRYGLGRDAGLQFWGSVLNKKVEWRAGVFNGNGLTRGANDNAKFLLAARVQIQPNGDPKYSEGDFDSTDKVLWAVGAFYNHNDLRFTTTNNDLDLKTWGIDGVLKKGGVFLTGAYYSRAADPETGLSFDDEGWFGQGGYLFGKQHWEVALRYGQFDPSNLVTTGDKQKELGGVLSYYYNKHNLKVQADFRTVENEAGNSGAGTTNNEFRLQTQFIF